MKNIDMSLTVEDIARARYQRTMNRAWESAGLEVSERLLADTGERLLKMRAELLEETEQLDREALSQP